MRTFIIGATALATAIVAAPAMAQDAAPAAPAATPAFTINGGATLVSDYRFRGISQTDRHFAVQGTMTLTHKSGVYISVWGSSIDDYVANTGDQEIDLIAGIKHSFGKVTVDGGVLYYYYPGSASGPLSGVGGGAYQSDFFEPYLSVSGTIGPVTAKLGGAYAPKQHAIHWNHNRDDNLYVYGELGGGIPHTPLSILAHVGHTSGRSALSLGAKGYWDYNIGLTYTWKALSFGVSYVDTSFKKHGTLDLADTPAFGTPHSLFHEVKGGVVGSIGVAF
jgi:uncharacterized protein (TIGR02001 family)